ncbi:MAG TPA: hypothetical protein VL992_12520 [Tepidisphaeraceae bacterium]|nr:hypothetical protein [Tepidisphaeraceae bacterium]
MRLLPLAALLALLLTACDTLQPIPRTPEEEAMFGPVSMRLHPTFTEVKNWTGGTKPDGIEAVVEFDDAFHEPTKAAGTLIFELFGFRRGYADPRGPRLLMWNASIMTFDEQQAHWHREFGAYSFLLSDPEIRLDQDYILTATYQSPNGKRFMDRTVLIAQKPAGRTPKAVANPYANEGEGPSPRHRR